MKMFATLLLFLTISMQPAFANTPAPSSQDALFSEWMSYYYLRKDNSKTEDFIKWLQDSQILENKETALKPFAAFLSEVFKENPSQVLAWVSSAKPTGKTKEALEFGLWLSGNSGIIYELFKETPDFAKTSVIPLSNLSPRNPADLDMMWGAFCATGDDQFVRKIINVLDDSTPLAGNSTIDTLTRRAAEWSLGSNMLQHELVNRIVRKEATARSGETKQKLLKIISSTDDEITRNSFPNHVGEFSALLVVTPEKALKEFDKPSTEVMLIKEASKAKRGDIVAVKLVFTGMALSNDLSADVTFDTKILDPNGNIYGGSDQKGMAALRGKVPMRFRIFDNGSFIKIRFEPKDILGKYKVISVIHDNVGKKQITLIKEIELTSE